ncbi:MAG: glycogen debranching enzyme N-terminal domain-containing protein, partial [Planctomycetota bacterium]
MSTTLPDVPTVPHVIEGDPAHLEGIEWLLTNGIGGFAMGTALGVNRRKYHTMLNAASNPPVERIATVNRLDEQVLLDPGTPNQESIDLALHATASGEIGPGDPARVVRFEKDATTCRWTFTYGASSMTKELRLGWRRNCCAIRYTIRAHRKQRLVVRPRVTLRDFHDVLERVDSTRLSVEARARGCTVQADGQSIEIVADAGSFERRDDIGPTVVRDAYYAL